MAVKLSMTSSGKKTEELVAERNLFKHLILLALKNKLCMEKVLAYPLGPVPWSLATADGAPVKTNKATLLHKLEEGHSLTTLQMFQRMHKPICAVFVIDGNAMLQAVAQVRNNFGELAEYIFAQLPNATRVDFVTDTYQQHSINHMETDRRGMADKFLVSGPSTKVPGDYKQFLANSENKTQLIQLLLREWK